MRYTPSPSKDAGTGDSLRRFGQSVSILLFHVGAFLTAVSAYGQTPPLSPKELLSTDPASFLQWLEHARPAPISPLYRARALAALPSEGEVTQFDGAARRKLTAVAEILRATARDTVYDIKVVDVRNARVGVYERAVVLISKPALTLLEAGELQAIVAHEIGHEYLSSDYEHASELEDHRRLKDLELLCDAIAIVTLQRLGKNPQRLMAGVEKMDRYNQRLSRSRVNRTNYPTLSERRAFAREVTKWAAASPNRSSR
jgi:hypothetical protein